MTSSAKTVERFHLYSQTDGTCSVKSAGDDAPPHVCPSLVDAVTFAQNLKTGSTIHMTVYDAAGKVLFQSFA